MDATIFRFNQTIARRILDRSQHNGCCGSVLGVFANYCLEIEISKYVPVKYDRRFANKILGKLVSSGRTHRLRLNSVFEVYAIIKTIAKQLFDLVWLIGKRERDVGYPRTSERVNLVKQKRPIANWHDRLGSIDGQGPQPRAFTAGKN